MPAQLLESTEQWLVDGCWPRDDYVFDWWLCVWLPQTSKHYCPRSHTGLQKPALWYAGDSVMTPQNSIQYHIWSFCDHNFWFLGILPIFTHVVYSLFDWKTSYLFFLMKLWLQNWSCSDLDLWPLDFKFSEILNTAPLNPFWWQKVLPSTFKRSYDSKAEFLPIFGHVVTSTFELWNPKSNIFIVLVMFTLSPNLKEINSYILNIPCYQGFRQTQSCMHNKEAQMDNWKS